MKKIYLTLISCLLLMSMVLAGCGNAKNTPTESPTEGAVEGNNDTFTIHLGAWFIDDRTFMGEFKSSVEKKFKEKYPNATISWDILLGATFFDKLKAELASNTAPDVFFHQKTLTKYVEAGYLADLTDQPWASKLSQGAKEATTYKGKVYAGALGLGADGVWYNKKIFADLGLTPPKTWTDFITVMDKIKAANITPMALGFKDAWTVNQMFNHIAQSVFYGISPNFVKGFYDGTSKLDGPEMIDTLNKFQTMTEKGYFNKTALSIDWPQSADLFTSGQAATILQGSWMPGTAADSFTKKGYAKFDLGYFPIPDDKGYTNIAVSSNQSLSVNARTKLLQPSKDLVSIILSPEILGPFNVGNGSIPAIQGTEVKYPDPSMNDLLAAINDAKTNVSYISYIAPSALNSILANVTKIVSGSKFDPKDLKDAVDKMAKDKATIVLPEE